MFSHAFRAIGAATLNGNDAETGFRELPSNIEPAYTVETETKGFAPCWWPATNQVRAEALAKELSLKHAANPAYPNAFWVIAPGDHVLGKYFKGSRYVGSATI